MDWLQDFLESASGSTPVVLEKLRLSARVAQLVIEHLTSILTSTKSILLGWRLAIILTRVKERLPQLFESPKNKHVSNESASKSVQ